MPAQPFDHHRDRGVRWWRAVPVILALLALAVTAPGFGNRFVQDDLPLILRNETVHTLSSPAKFFTTPYWHDPFPPAHYRPLATAGLALQWKAGGGAPALYRRVSAVLLAATALALFALAALILPMPAAALAAGLFVVHPVHVESTALGVNQAEMMVALLATLAVAWYVRTRRRGDLAPGVTAGLVALFVAACLFKENGLMLAGLLLAAELTLVEDRRPFAERLRRLRPFYLLLVLAGATLLGIRTAVLGGDVVGTFAADALAGASPLTRGTTMLGVVPEWARLLFWPARLQADYGPDEIVAAAEWGAAQWIGAALCLGWGLAVFATRRILPVLSFGLAWLAVALLPVSNVLVPTGVVLAERTMFLASAGAALAAGAVVSLAWRGRAAARPALRWSAIGFVVLLAGLGMLRSRARHGDWRDQETLLRRTVLDAPRSFAAHLALARFLEDSGSTSDAAAQYRKAVDIRPGLVLQDRALADQYRLAGFCRPAIRLYRRALTVLPGDSAMRAALASCTDSVPMPPPR